MNTPDSPDSSLGEFSPAEKTIGAFYVLVDDADPPGMHYGDKAPLWYEMAYATVCGNRDRSLPPSSSHTIGCSILRCMVALQREYERHRSGQPEPAPEPEALSQWYRYDAVTWPVAAERPADGAQSRAWAALKEAIGAHP